MTRILKRPADPGTSLRLPVRAVDVRSHARTASHDVRAQDAPVPVPVPDPQALKAELDALRERAVREGIAQGRAQAEKEVRAALDTEVAQWRTGLQGIEAAVLEKLQAVEPMAVAIGFQAMATVLGESYADRDAIVGAVRRLLDAAASTVSLKVRVAPSQLERVRAALEQAPAPGGRRLQFEADPALSATDCRIVSDRGQLETGLELQLQSVQDALLRAHDAHRPSKEGA